jgi:hypothetical protein
MLALLAELLGSFTYGLVAVVSEICKILCKRLGGNVNKHGHLLRGPCDRCLLIFIFRVPLENSPYAVSDTGTRDLISSYFRFPWRVTLMDFRAFARALHPRRSIVHPVAPPGERCPGAYCATDCGVAILVSANPVNASVTI